jgi:glucose-6-phosphate-specific signal transduction histidine kinase
VRVFNDELLISVRDDGRGGADLAGGSGLVGLQDRVEALGGRLSLRSPAGAGTAIDISLPLNGASPGDAGIERSAGDDPQDGPIKPFTSAK